MKRILLLLTLLAPISLFGITLSSRPQNIPLPAEAAFQVQLITEGLDKGRYLIRVAPGHYLYRNKFALKSNPEKAITSWSLPAGEMIQDPFFGKQSILKNDIELSFTYKPTLHQLILEYQGCAESGFCYPPEKKMYQRIATGFEPSTSTTLTPPPQEKPMWLLLLGFFGLGLALSITPCVLPMVPILGNLLLSQKNSRLSRSFVGIAYALGVISAYTVAGMVAAKLGLFMQGLLQHPGILIGSSVMLLLLALWQIDRLKLPTKWWHPGSHQVIEKEISLFFAFFMGLISVAVVSPCVTPPLIAALGFISQTGSMAEGATLLAMSGFGVSVPLLIVTFFGTRFLPKRGHWMHHVKEGLALGLVAVALSLINRLLPSAWVHTLWALYSFLIAVWLFYWKGHQIVKKTAKLAAIMLTFFTISHYYLEMSEHPFSPHAIVTTPQKLTEVIAQAKSEQALILLDFYADWCSNCHEVEEKIFQNKAIQEKLTSVWVVRVDLSVFSDDAQALLTQLKVIAPPTLIFWHPTRGELAPERLVGEFSETDFEQALARAQREME